MRTLILIAAFMLPALVVLMACFRIGYNKNGDAGSS
jgi:hypothetical protein